MEKVLQIHLIFLSYISRRLKRNEITEKRENTQSSSISLMWTVMYLLPKFAIIINTKIRRFLCKFHCSIK